MGSSENLVQAVSAFRGDALLHGRDNIFPQRHKLLSAAFVARLLQINAERQKRSSDFIMQLYSGGQIFFFPGNFFYFITEKPQENEEINL